MDESILSNKPRQTVASQKIFDVAPPGKSAPSSTTRPLIIMHPSLSHDPMVSDVDMNSVGEKNAAEAETLPTEEQSLRERSSKERIEPVEIVEAVDEKSVGDSQINTDDVQESAGAKTGKHIGLTVKPPEQKERLQAKESTESDEDAEEINEFAGQAAAKKAKKTEDEEETKRLETAQSLVESRQYVVPIRAPHARRVTFWAILAVALGVIGCAAGYLVYIQ